MIRCCSLNLRFGIGLRSHARRDSRCGGYDPDQNEQFQAREHDDATHVVEVTWTIDVDVAGLMERKEEQKGAAFLILKTLTIIATLEHCSGGRLRSSGSWTGEA